MPKYGDTTRLWGALDYTYGVDGTNPGGELQWIFLVDWDGNDSFNYNEAQYLIDLDISRGERYFMRPDGNGFESIRPGDGTATLTDNSGRFDPDNDSGPLYGKILPGRKFRLMVKDLATDVVYPVMAGFINDIPPLSEVNQIQLSLRESFSLLDRKVNLPLLYHTNISDAIDMLVSGAHWPALFGRDIDTETQPVTTFALDNINALDTMIELAAASIGQIFTDNTGRLKYYSRSHSSMPTVNLDQAQCLKQIRRAQPFENQRNIIQIEVKKKVKTGAVTLWETGSPLKVGAFSTVNIKAGHKDAVDVYVYKFIANSAVDFTGTNRVGTISISTDTTNVNSTGIRIVNLINSVTYVIAVLVGSPIEERPTTIVETNDLTSETVFDMKNPWMQDISHAQAYATIIADFLETPQRTIEVQIEQRPAVQFSFDLMDKIAFTSAKLNIDATYYAGAIEHKWNTENGQSVTTTLVMRPRITDSSSIDNDPEDPSLPFIPPGTFPFPNTPPTPPPAPPDPGDIGGCLYDQDAGPTGPYNTLRAPFSLQSNYTTEIRIATPAMWSRPAGFTNPTKIAIAGEWLVWNTTTGAWDRTTNSSFWHASINDIELTKDAYTDSGLGVRTLTYNLGGAEYIRSVRVWLDASTLNGFTPGAAIASGTVAATDSTGDAVSLTVGNYYSIEGTGGPWIAGGGFTANIWRIGMVGGSLDIDVGLDENTSAFAENGGMAYDRLSSAYGRAYFRASATINYVKVRDSVYGDNSGSMGYIVRTATYNTLYRLNISQIMIYNYCV